MSNGAALKARAKALGLKQTEVAERSGLSTGFISDLFKDKKKLGADGARRLAPVLDMSITELLGESTGEIEDWFWPVRFTTLSADELSRLRRQSPEERISWVLHEVQSAYPDLNLPDTCGLSLELTQRLIGGTALTTEWQLKLLTENLKLPPQFLLTGEPGPNTELARKILAHSNATEWLSVVDFAIQNDVPAVAILDAIRAFLRTTKR